MAQIGKMNLLTVSKEVDFGVYLDGENLGEILLPKKQVPEGVSIDDPVTVFIYHDSNDKLIATTTKPHAFAGDFAMLKVIDSNPVGTFFDWGLPKDLLMPYAEKRHRMEVGKTYLVRVFVDEESSRIAASALLEEFLDETSSELEAGQEVKLIIERKTEMGFRAIINEECLGMLYDSEIFKTLTIGDRVTGFIKQIRDDGKIDLWLQKQSYKQIDPLSQKVLDYLQTHDGIMYITDKSSPEMIKKTFHVSKGTFKKAIGSLYKSRKVSIEGDHIKLSKES